VTVTGGREGVVGVGGLLLGCGIGWTNARTGFGCDSVVNYEVVLANGQIVNANASSNAELWKALKGGGCNFGIVTRFDIEAFPAHNLAIETRAINLTHANDFVDAVAAFTNLDRSFQDNAMISIIRYDPEAEEIGLAVTEVNTVNNANSSAFDAMNRIPTLTASTKTSVTIPESVNSTELANNLM
jgi:FAD/FMN-containing dehydrogenase